MKKILFVLALVMSAAATMAQESVKVTTTDGKVISGQFVNGSDSVYTIRVSDQYIIHKYGNDTISFLLSDIKEVYMYNQPFVPFEGRLVAKKSIGEKTTPAPRQTITTTYISNGNQETIYRSIPTNPSYMIGKALKTTGDVSLGIGIPCLVSGSILLAVGYSSMDMYLTTRSQITIAGSILFPIGASLTIVGIPLHAHGKKIMTMNFNYTGNGVGVGLEF